MALIPTVKIVSPNGQLITINLIDKQRFINNGYKTLTAELETELETNKLVEEAVNNFFKEVDETNKVIEVKPIKKKGGRPRKIKV